MASKIIVSGPAAGNFRAVLEKIAKLHSKNSFSLAIILGDFFAGPESPSDEHDMNVSALINGKIEIPLPTYFTVGKHPLPTSVIEKLEKSDDELCPNLYFLGKRSTTKTSEGLRIVNLAGSLDPTILAGVSKDKYLPFHTEDDAKALRGANSADILLTSHWPADIRKGSKISLPDGIEAPAGEQYVANLCSALRPRYHFGTTSDAFYERESFFHRPTEDEPDTKHITRFISLASSDNPSKQKSLYAFTIDPTSSVPLTLPPGTTASPFTTAQKRQRLPDQEQPYSRFSVPNGRGNHYRPNKRSRYTKPPPGPQDCFFCLSSSKVNTNLIASIANDTYLTTAKGPLSTSSTYPNLPSPTHLLIIPLEHSPTLSSIPVPEDRARTYKEMQRYRRALHSFLLSHPGEKLGAVTWDVSRAAGIHNHWQFLPVPVGLVKKGLVEAAFKVEAENEKYPVTFRTKDLGDGTVEKGDFFRVWIWMPSDDDKVDGQDDGGGLVADADGGEDGEEKRGKQKCLVLPLSATFRFDIQFGRKVMAKLLGLEGRRDWRDCEQTDQEELEDAGKFKEAFKKFDWALEQ
ncbi:MAG: hypothetical protein L6R42_001514 [Xanthoria sp. 1 TBL-2021]|nr:MAG: hypothetical protein L6R42_001514 [Xanthoria sp. 1 TBL-2021]